MQTDALLARWSRGFDPLAIQGALKSTPDDFQVTEVADHAAQPEPDGPHLYLYLEKRNQTTRELARGLADENGLPISDIGYSGMKDKRAVTRQWVSLPLGPESLAAPGSGAAQVALPAGTVELGRVRKTKKLRRGWHQGNSFELVLRGVSGASEPVLTERLRTLRATGVPNYFGAQRFGQDNLTQAIAWLPRRRRERNAFRRGLHLSVLRSFLFNEVLSARIQAGSWNQLLAGETTPEGPLWGRGRVPASEEVCALEAAALAEFRGIADELEFAGLQQQRRSLVLMPEDLQWSVASASTQGLDVTLSFSLPGGGYATSVLRELGDFTQPPDGIDRR